MASVLKAERKKKINPKSFFSGFVRNEESLCELPECIKSKFLSEKLEKLWFGLKPKKKKASIVEPLLKCHFLTYFFLGLTQLIVKTSLIVGYPFLIDKFFGVSLVVLFLFEALYDQWYMFKLKILQLQIESALSGLIYRKSLKLFQVPFGKILTFMTKDCHNLNTSLRRANDVWIYTLQSIFLIYLIFRKVGLAVLVPIFCFLIILLQQVRLALKSKILKTKLLQTTDSRFEVTQTVLFGIKSVKLNKSETHFGEKLDQTRLEEVAFTHKIFLLKFLIASNATLWICASFFPWTAIFLKDTPLDVIFYLFRIYQILGHVLLSIVPFSISQSAQTLATIARIDDFLHLREVQKARVTSHKSAQITLKGVTVAINKETVLRDINLDLRTGLHQVIGAVGSGKTFLLKTILRECEPIRGEVLVQGSCSYSCQKPWVFASTIRENILFGENFDEGRFSRVLQVCDLQKLDDLAAVQSVSLSQGQRARINLARAIYKNCDVYLLDDPLASLDYLAKSLIFQKCSSFLRGKLVIFAARELYDCPNCVVLENGKLICFEKFETPTTENFIKLCPPTKIEEEHVENASEETHLLAKPLLRNLFEEKTKVGRVDLRVYKKWIQTSGLLLFVFVTFLLACLPPMVKMFDSSLASWNATKTQPKNVIARHIALFMIYLIFVVISTIVFLIFAKNASIKLHKLLSQVVLNTDLAFFGKNFSGQILSRFSRDLLVLDEVLPFLFYDSCKTLFSAVGAMIGIILVQKIFLVAVIILIFGVASLRKKFLSVATDLKRLEATAKSSIIDYFNSSLVGLPTIRAKNKNSSFHQEFENRLDLYTSASFTYLCTKRIFFISYSLVASVFFGVIISRFLVITTEPPSVQFALHQALFFIQILREGLLKWTEFETNLVSVERILNYSDQKKIKSKIEKIQFGISPNKKIGIIGASGAGKTALLLTLVARHEKVSGFSEDPIFFQSTIRENVDPLRQHTDSEIWSILKALNFNRFVFDLDEEMFDLSEGEKELICLARVVLERSDFVIIDNPSVFLDLKLFLGRTVVVVSHNPRILEQCDKIVLFPETGAGVLCVA